MERLGGAISHDSSLGRALRARAVLFDMDGVLTVNGPFHGRAWQHFAREQLALTLTENDQRIHGGRTEEILTALTGTVPDAEAIRACEIVKEGHYRSLARGNLRPVAGLIPYLAMLAERNVPCALVTSADVINIAFVLGEIGLTDRFLIMVTAEDVRRGKPDPEPYLLAAVRVGVDPAYCLVHEDAPAGIRSAVAAGSAVVALTTTFPAELLEAAGAELHVPDFAAWLALIHAHESGSRA
jgi:HAD superfamily hydrolase (TIGR01509 family)